MHCHSVVMKGFRECDEDVIHVDNDFRAKKTVPVFQGVENTIHHGLESAREVGEAEKHDQWLEQAIFGFEGCLVLVPFLDVYIVVSPANIKLGEDVHIFELCDEFWDEW
jgi:hypothetical protein